MKVKTTTIEEYDLVDIPEEVFIRLAELIIPHIDIEFYGGVVRLYNEWWDESKKKPVKSLADMITDNKDMYCDCPENIEIDKRALIKALEVLTRIELKINGEL